MSGLQTPVHETSLPYFLGVMAGFVEAVIRVSEPEDAVEAIWVSVAILVIYLFIRVDQALTTLADAWWDGVVGLCRLPFGR